MSSPARYEIVSDYWSPTPDVVALDESRAMVAELGWGQPELREDLAGDLWWMPEDGSEHVVLERTAR